MIKQENRVIIECSDSSKKIKATIIDCNEDWISVQTPTGYILDLKRSQRRGPYKIQLGLIEFYTDGLTYK